METVMDAIVLERVAVSAPAKSRLQPKIGCPTILRYLTGSDCRSAVRWRFSAAVSCSTKAVETMANSRR